MTLIYQICNQKVLQLENRIIRAPWDRGSPQYFHYGNGGGKWRNILSLCVEQDAFDKIKHIMVCGALLIHPDFNEAFKIHTNASAFQLVDVIRQKGEPISFYSIKLTDTKKQ